MVRLGSIVTVANISDVSDFYAFTGVFSAREREKIILQLGHLGSLGNCQYDHSIDLSRIHGFVFMGTRSRD